MKVIAIKYPKRKKVFVNNESSNESYRCVAIRGRKQEMSRYEAFLRNFISVFLEKREIVSP